MNANNLSGHPTSPMHHASADNYHRLEVRQVGAFVHHLGHDGPNRGESYYDNLSVSRKERIE
jgi:hypothetical protein